MIENAIRILPVSSLEWTTCAKVLLPIPFLPRMISRLSTITARAKFRTIPCDNMLRRLPEPEGNATVLNTAADPEHIQALFLWEEDNVPTKTRFTENMTGYFDPWDFRPYVTAIPVRTGVQPKGAVVLMAGGAYQFRGNYTDSLPTAAALRELGFQTFIVEAL